MIGKRLGLWTTHSHLRQLRHLWIKSPASATSAVNSVSRVVLSLDPPPRRIFDLMPRCLDASLPVRTSRPVFQEPIKPNQKESADSMSSTRFRHVSGTKHIEKTGRRIRRPQFVRSESFRGKQGLFTSDAGSDERTTGATFLDQRSVREEGPDSGVSRRFALDPRRRRLTPSPLGRGLG